MAVLKIRGKEADTNFPREIYLEELREMRASEMSVEDFIVCMRDRAKRRSKALKEEEEERRAKFLAGLVKRQANASASAANPASWQRSALPGLRPDPFPGRVLLRRRSETAYDGRALPGFL